MIYLQNYSKVNTFICLRENSYSVVNGPRKIDGIGGFSDENEMLGCYMKEGVFYFCYENNVYEVKLGEISCTNEWIDNEKRKFQVLINGENICEIIYKPYVSPLALGFSEDDEEFDFLLYLSRILYSEETVMKFCGGMQNNKF